MREQFEREEFFFVVNADTVQFPRYDALRDALLARNALAALTLRHPPAHDKFTAVPLLDGLVTGFGKGEGEPLMFAGSHAISSKIFRHLPDRESAFQRFSTKLLYRTYNLPRYLERFRNRGLRTSYAILQEGAPKAA